MASLSVCCDSVLILAFFQVPVNGVLEKRNLEKLRVCSDVLINGQLLDF